MRDLPFWIMFEAVHFSCSGGLIHVPVHLASAHWEYAQDAQLQIQPR